MLPPEEVFTSGVRDSQSVFAIRCVVSLGNPAYNSGTMNAEVQRLINLLRTAMRILGVTNRDIERKLGLSPSYLSRLYSGGIELKVEHLIEIPQAMGLEPAEFFHLAYPRRVQPSRSAEQLRQIIRELTPPSAPEPPSGGFTDEQMQQLREMMGKMLGREAEGKG